LSFLTGGRYSEVVVSLDLIVPHWTTNRRFRLCLPKCRWTGRKWPMPNSSEVNSLIQVAWRGSTWWQLGVLVHAPLLFASWNRGKVNMKLSHSFSSFNVLQVWKIWNFLRPEKNRIWFFGIRNNQILGLFKFNWTIWLKIFSWILRAVENIHFILKINKINFMCHFFLFLTKKSLLTLFLRLGLVHQF